MSFKKVSNFFFYYSNKSFYLILIHIFLFDKFLENCYPLGTTFEIKLKSFFNGDKYFKKDMKGEDRIVIGNNFSLKKKNNKLKY